MPEPLIRSEHVVGEWDPLAESFSARDWTPGPAGTAGLLLRGGVELEVDVASPGTFVGLAADADGGVLRRSTLEALERLLGRERVAALLALQKSKGPKVLPGLHGGRSAVEELYPRRHPSDPDVFRGTARDREGGVAPGLARVALADAASTDPSASTLVRALGHLDAALAASIFSPGIGFGTRARIEAVAGAELLLDVARRGELEGQPIDELALAAALEQLVLLLPAGLDEQIRVVADRTRQRRTDEALEDTDSRQKVMYAPAAAAPAEAEPAGAARAKQRPVAPILQLLDPRSLPLELANAQVVVRATTGSELEVRIAGRARDAEGLWARAHGADDVVLAAAPFLTDRKDAVARLLVPPDALTTAEVDVTGSPGEPRPSRRLRAMAAAISAGQAAARAERLGRPGVASQRWRASGESWEQAGDPARSGQAHELAEGGGRRQRAGRVPPPLLADQLVEAADG